MTRSLGTEELYAGCHLSREEEGVFPGQGDQLSQGLEVGIWEYRSAGVTQEG